MRKDAGLRARYCVVLKNYARRAVHVKCRTLPEEGVVVYVSGLGAVEEQRCGGLEVCVVGLRGPQTDAGLQNEAVGDLKDCPLDVKCVRDIVL